MIVDVCPFCPAQEAFWSHLLFLLLPTPLKLSLHFFLILVVQPFYYFNLYLLHFSSRCLLLFYPHSRGLKLVSSFAAPLSQLRFLDNSRIGLGTRTSYVDYGFNSSIRLLGDNPFLASKFVFSPSQSIILS